MPVGNSGRVVIEIDPEIKKELHELLRSEGSNLKEWFLVNVEQYFAQKDQIQLDLLDPHSATKEGNNASK